MGALLALHEAGIEVPAEVSVVGFDNMPESRFFNPPLTTATSDFDVMARESLDILFAKIQGTPERFSGESSDRNWSGVRAPARHRKGENGEQSVLVIVAVPGVGGVLFERTTITQARMVRRSFTSGLVGHLTTRL